MKDSDLFPLFPKRKYLPDELLYSLVARHHYLGGFPRGETCSQAWFGWPGSFRTPHLLSPLDFYSTCVLPSSDSNEDIEKHTIFGFYSVLLTPEEAVTSRQALKQDAVGAKNYFWGVSPKAFSSRHPLKACMQCIATDKQKIGVAYWRTTHQTPGLWICPIHGCMLRYPDFRHCRIAQIWHLPHAITTWISPFADSDEDATTPLRKIKLQRLATNSMYLRTLCAEVHIDVKRLYSVIHKRLETRELESHLIDNESADFEFYRKFPEFSRICDNLLQRGRTLNRTLLGNNILERMLTVVVLVNELFDSAEQFFATYNANKYESPPPQAIVRSTSEYQFTPERRERRAEEKKCIYRLQTGQAMADNPTLGLLAPKLLFPKAYRWLSKFDRTWLQVHRAEMATAYNNSERHNLPPNDALDVALVRQVQNQLIAIEQRTLNKTISLTKLYAHAPELRKKMAMLERLPRTLKLVKEIQYAQLRRNEPNFHLAFDLL